MEDLAVHAHRSKVAMMLAALAKLRALQLTPEEEEALDGFETFRNEHPIRLASLNEEGDERPSS